MVLKEILYKVALEAVHGSTDVEVNNIHFDSRKIELTMFLWPFAVRFLMDMNL